MVEKAKQNESPFVVRTIQNEKHNDEGINEWKTTAIIKQHKIFNNEKRKEERCRCVVVDEQV